MFQELCFSTLLKMFHSLNSLWLIITVSFLLYLSTFSVIISIPSCLKFDSKSSKCEALILNNNVGVLERSRIVFEFNSCSATILKGCWCPVWAFHLSNYEHRKMLFSCTITMNCISHCYNTVHYVKSCRFIQARYLLHWGMCQWRINTPLQVLCVLGFSSL